MAFPKISPEAADAFPRWRGFGQGGTRLEMFEMFDMSLRSSQQSRLSPYSIIKGDSIDSITILKF